jgi:glycine cleavage system aminomethyltransferase T
VWGSDITPETTPDEAGLGFAVRVQIGVFGDWCDATVREEPLFDPTNTRVKG